MYERIITAAEFTERPAVVCLKGTDLPFRSLLAPVLRKNGLNRAIQ